MKRIIAVVTVFDTDELLPFFCEHYLRLGVDKILIAIRSKKQIIDVRQRFGDRVVMREFSEKEFREHRKMYGEEQMLKAEELHPDDWVLHLDLDEFHQYPANLRDVCAVAEAENIWAIRGELFDRVCPDGKMRDIDPLVPLDQQFTHTAWLTKHLVNGISRKIMLARRRVKIMGGRHHVKNAKAARWPIGFHHQYLVHHFRWHGNLVDRILYRSTLIGNKWMDNHVRAMHDYVRSGSLDLQEPILDLKPAGPLRYPAESQAMKFLARKADPFALQPAEIQCLLRIVLEHKVMRILEFGPGKSTAAFAGADCQVTSFESNPSYFRARSRQLEHDRIDIRFFDPRGISSDHDNQTYDLAFIDGPTGKDYSFVSRLDAVQHAMDRTPLLLLHDTNRCKERNTVRFLEQLGWHVVQEHDVGRGLTLMGTPNRNLVKTTC